MPPIAGRRRSLRWTCERCVLRHGAGGAYTYPINGVVTGSSYSDTVGPYDQLPSYTSHATGTISPDGKTITGTFSDSNGTHGTFVTTRVGGSGVAPTTTAQAKTVSGKVLVRLPGSGAFVDLATLTSVPFGSVLDARAGTVRITTSRRGGGTQSAIFYDGEFALSQDKSRRVIETLTGEDFTPCGTSASGARSSASRGPAKRSSRVVAKLWGNGHGNFRTRGRYAAATVRGTKWLTEDRCDGTRITVSRGTVSVSDFRLHRTVSVSAPNRYLARR